MKYCSNFELTRKANTNIFTLIYETAFSPEIICVPETQISSVELNGSDQVHSSIYNSSDEFLIFNGWSLARVRRKLDGVSLILQGKCHLILRKQKLTKSV
jgi:hypothetical protein